MLLPSHLGQHCDNLVSTHLSTFISSCFSTHNLCSNNTQLLLWPSCPTPSAMHTHTHTCCSFYTAPPRQPSTTTPIPRESFDSYTPFNTWHWSDFLQKALPATFLCCHSILGASLINQSHHPLSPLTSRTLLTSVSFLKTSGGTWQGVGVQ